MIRRILKYLNDDRSLRPERALVHPMWVVAVAVLLVNDHVLKPAALAEPVIGKVSDFAGLFLAPVLLAAILRANRRSHLWACGALVGAVFAAINVSPVAAALFDSAVGLIGPSLTTVDPTDLIALVAIPAGLVFFEPEMRRLRANTTRRALEFAAVLIGATVSTATSNPCAGGDCGEFIPDINSQVSVLNKTYELHVLRMRYLRPDVQINCDEVAVDPGRYLTSAAFGPPESWFIQSGQEAPVQPGVRDEWGGFQPTQAECHAALIESDTVPDILLFWDGDLPVRSYQFDADIPRDIPADPQTIVLDADYSRTPDEQLKNWRERSSCGERADLCGNAELEPLAEIPDGVRYEWRATEGVEFSRRPVIATGTAEQIPEQCRVPGPGDGIAWEQPPAGEVFVLGIEQGRDGCHEVLWTPERDLVEDAQGWWVCLPFEALAFLEPSAQTLSRMAVSRISEPATFSRGGYEGLRIDATSLPTDPMSGEQTEFRRIFVSRGFGVPEEVNLSYEARPREGCDPVEVSCGQVAIPTDVAIEQYGEIVAPGDSVTLGEVVRQEVHVVRAEYRPVLDASCEAENGMGVVGIPDNPQEPTFYLELVNVTQ